jgi:RNA polymerase primary sigma factor
MLPVDDGTDRVWASTEAPADQSAHGQFRMPLALYMRDVRGFPLLTRDEERRMTVAMARGDSEARRRVVEHNLRLVLAVALRHAGRGVPVEDLVQEGNLGLLHAAEKYDPDYGCKFSTYAYRWILDGVVRAIRRSKGLPFRIVSQIRMVTRVEEGLAAELGRFPTNEEVAARADVTLRDVQELRSLRRPHLSLEASVGDLEVTLGDLLEDEGAERPDEAVHRKIEREELVRLLRSLPPRQRVIVALRYGLFTDDPQTLDAIGLELGITGERTRQIELSMQGELARDAAWRAWHAARNNDE